MKTDGTILIVDDDQDILIAGKLLLKRHFSNVLTCSQPEKIPQLFNEQQFDAVLLDMNFGPGESSGKLPISSRNKVPPLAALSRPILFSLAPVKAPF